MNQLKAPWNIQRLFDPLIETQDDLDNAENPLCRLCHSTVHEFIISHPSILGNDEDSPEACKYPINAFLFGPICLRYLSQSKYSTLLCDSATGLPGFTGEDLSVHARGETNEADEHNNLWTYCARFWVKHLEQVSPSMRLSLRESVLEFLKSPNYQSLLQVQSLTVSRQFSQFLVRSDSGFRQFARRQALPWWIGDKYSFDYRHFALEWSYLLDLGICRSADCEVEHFSGEIDRCLSGISGPDSFMRNMRERYKSFTLVEESLFDTVNTDHVIAEGHSHDGHFIVVSLHKWLADKSRCRGF